MPIGGYDWYRTKTHYSPNFSQQYHGIKAISLEHAVLSQVIAIQDLQDALEKVHKDVSYAVAILRKDAIAAQSKATNIVPPSFEVDCFVLVRLSNDRTHKLRFKWFGPIYLPLSTGLLSMVLRRYVMVRLN